jgi:hypothetical protein
MVEFSMWTDRWTDRRDKLVFAFRNYANAPKNNCFVAKMSMYTYKQKFSIPRTNI